jgi:hypothetical protein
MNAIDVSCFGIVAIGVHELAHIAAAKITASRIDAVGLKWTGLYVSITVFPACRWKCAVNLSAGLLANLLLAGFLFAPVLDLVNFGFVNAWLLVGNIILPKSDGWQIFQMYRKAN